MTARAFVISVLAVLALIGAGGAGYLLLTKKSRTDAALGVPVNAATMEGEDVEDALAVEAPPSDIPDAAGQVTGDALGEIPQIDGDPWLDPETVDGAEVLEGSGDFIDGEEPFEDVYDPSAGGFEGGGAPIADPIDPSELPPPEGAPAGEPKADEPPQDQPQ